MLKLLKIAAFAVPACAMLSITEPANAANDVNTAAASAASASRIQAKASETKKVCVNVIPDTGSRMTRRMCKTKAEWADEGLDLDAEK